MKNDGAAAGAGSDPVSGSGPIYEFGPFRLDALRRQVTRAGEPLDLTPKAFEVLLVLVRRPGQLVEKDEMMRVVWPDTFVDEANLAQQVSAVRRALGDSPEHSEFISTVPRRGYRLVVPVRQVAQPTTSSQPSPSAGFVRSSSTPIHTATEEPAPTARGSLGRWKWRIAIVALMSIALAFGVLQMRRLQSPAPMVRFVVTEPDGGTFSTSGGFMAVSPDGLQVAFVASLTGGREMLWLRSLESLSAAPVAGTEGAFQPFWSPDSQSIAFFAGGSLKRISLRGGEIRTICSTPPPPRVLAGSWNADGVILFSLVNDGLLRVSASGGPSAAFASPDRSKDERFLAWPRFLPDGQHFLYLVDSSRPEVRGIYVGRLGSTMRKRVLGAFSSAAFAQDHLLWSEGGTVLAQRFDLSNLELMADPFPVAQQVAHNIGTGRAVFSLSQTGVLAYRSVPETQLTWFDRAGSPQGTIGSPGIHFSFSLSPRLSAIAADRVDQETGRSDVWVIDAESGGERRLTFDSALDFMPLWSADGARIVFVSTRNGAWDLFEKSSTGEGGDRLLVHSSAAKRPVGWMLDRRTLIFSADDPQAGPSLWWLPDDGGRPRPISQGERTLAQAQLSPDGRYLAGVGDADALIVQSFPTLDDRWQISPPSGIYPRWRSDGRELFYITRDLSMMSVSVSYAPRFRAGPPTELFKVRTLSPSGLVGRSYDVTPDGQRFLVKVPTRPAPITVVVNWLQR